VVNIITRRGRGPLSGYASLEAGNYDTHRERAGFSGSAGPFDYALGGSWFESNGQFRNDGTEQRALSARVGTALPAGGHLGLSTRYTLTTTELPFDALTPRPASPFFVLDPNAVQESETLTLALAWDQKPVEWFEAHVRYGQFFNWLDFRDPATVADAAAGNVDLFVGDVRSEIDVERREVEAITAWHAGKWNTLTTGVEHRYEAGRNATEVAGARTRTSSDLDTLSFVAQDELRILDRLILSGGWRRDDHSVFGSATTHRAAAVVLVPETGSKLRGAWAQGFRAPTINDLFFPDTTGGLCPPFGNPALEPERSESWEAGVDQHAWQRRVRARLTYFQNRFRDLITVVAVPPTAAGLAAGFDVCFQGGNVGRARTEGVEVSLELEPVAWLLLEANYTFTDARNETTDTELVRFARHRWNARVTVSPTRRLTLFLQALVASSRFEAEGFPRTPGHHRIDAGGRYQVVERRGHVPALDVFARLNNLTDTFYMEPLGFRALGINALVGVEARY
jgi:vitamin B12 transporter